MTGPDGASHNGMWDLSILQLIPGIRIAAPRDGVTLREELREALAVDNGPTAVRFPTGAVGEDVPALERRGQVDVLFRGTSKDVLLVAVGAMGRRPPRPIIGRDRPGPAARWRTTRSTWPTGSSPAAPTAPAASRAG